MSHPWHSQQIHLFPSNTPPPPIAHKVWILNCKNCHMFLTNRGMKAVLLLQPNVSLYSSDALPVNCSPYNSNPHALWPPTSYKSSSSYMPPRTCECLTQSLCCHGCGNTIGYMIVIPCSRCTSSISATNRVTNGHRFVFQTGEVLGTERHYIPNEIGVIPFDTTGTNTASSPQPDAQLNLYPSRPARESPADSFGRVAHIDSLDSPPSLEYANLTLHYSDRQPSEDDSWAYPGRRLYYSPLQSRASHFPALVHPHYHPSNSTTTSTDARSQPPLITNLNSDSYTADQKYASIAPPILKAGDVIFWHHLARSGEIIGVIDDERARRPAGESAGGMDFDR